MRSKVITFPNKTRHSRESLYWVFMICVALIVIELCSSIILLYRYRLTSPGTSTFADEPSYLSSINLAYKAFRKAGLVGHTPTSAKPEYEYRTSSDPDPFLVDDDRLGYGAMPGVYTHMYFRRKWGEDAAWEKFPVKVTITEDSSRWTGDRSQNNLPKVFVIGDSCVFGSGVNDEQTFSYHLQSYFPEKEVKLYAMGGYALGQTYLRFLQLKQDMKEGDTIILGYADFYDRRNVASPEWMKNVHEWLKKWEPNAIDIKRTVPRISLNKTNQIEVDYVQQNCKFNQDYCEGVGPTPEEQTEVSVAIINFIATNTAAQVYVLHFLGSGENPLRSKLSQRVKLISALKKDFGYFVWDDIEGFDPHPGPYWHYAISRLLIGALSDGN